MHIPPGGACTAQKQLDTLPVEHEEVTNKVVTVKADSACCKGSTTTKSVARTATAYNMGNDLTSKQIPERAAAD